MATTLDGVTLANPVAGEDGQIITFVDVGNVMTMADGSQRFDYIGTRRRFDLRWVGVTAAQRNTLWNGYWTALLSAKDYSPPESTETYTVLAVRDSWSEGTWKEGGSTFRYNVGFALYEELPRSPELGMIKSESVSVAESVTMSDVCNPAISDSVTVAESVSAAVT